MTVFTPGQRWVSDSESELGLGTVLSQDGRLVVILFPASGETRHYAMRNAPLTRVRFSPGDSITHHEGWSLTVSDVTEQDGLLHYRGLRDDGSNADFAETMLDNFIQFRLASDRLFASQIDPLPWFGLRYESLRHYCRIQRSPLLGLAGVRTQPIAHQLHIARDVADRVAPRVLLADEVGLGKTIEAGLVIHRQIQTGRVRRVLIVVPENLQHQWLVEMLRRFNLRFALFNQERCDGAEQNPFEEEQLALVSLEFLLANDKAEQWLHASDWDLLVVDEAHHLVWHEEAASPEYTLVEQLAGQIPAVLLLTATPEQLGQASHFARLRLLDPDRFHDLEAFRAETLRYQPVAEAVQQLLDTPALAPEHREAISQWLGDSADSLLDAVQAGGETATEARRSLIRQLLDRHGTGRVLYRNTRAVISGFPERELHAYPLPCPALYDELQGRATLYPEVGLQDEFEPAETAWWQDDPRVDWLIDTLKSLKQHKVLVICAHAETALDVNDALRIRSGIPATVFHQGMSIIERDRAAAFFADEEFGAQVMICSEIGSEGRNFQFAHHLVMFDLPAHPDLLEQRIGRLDRIGQKHTIELHVPYLEGTAQERLFQWYDQGLNAFRATCPTGNALQQQYGDALEQQLEQPQEQEWQTLIAEAQQTRNALEAELHNGRDRLLELHSRGHTGEAQRLIETIERQDQDFQLPIYMERLFDVFGIDSEDHSDNALVLRPGERMLDAGFPLGDDEGVTITYDRDTALSREDMQFITWEHPMLQGGMDLVLSGSMGNSSVALLKNKALKPGTMLLECLFVSEAIAPRALQLQRYLPPTPVRCLLDINGNDLAAKVAFETLEAQIDGLPKHLASKIAKSQRDEVERLLDRAEALADIQHAELVEQASTRFTTDLDEEINRLKALQQVNPLVRQSEIDALEQQRRRGVEVLHQAKIRLDALRILVVG
ncbi:ATP-dependent helicase HepA [Pseudomonas saudimassiliensis]|uniref:RNA polymerase-associated protein RapA n=1 Tax=Pseudomonas saudimassiliensis TaxID=1461581 RepID=A0A078MFW3_9PSED|nr:RNA polymerase-associated protein RapA [Pseudomonas saudimassiliensis]CEA06213.1 ATP-dependent helicase HepA [Pseudomonas saudimassiliensis]CEF27638.1 ATP-dependent helicase HepA [Pseudomonas saudimassiliensis]